MILHVSLTSVVRIIIIGGGVVAESETSPTAGAIAAEIQTDVEVVKRLQNLESCYSSMLISVWRLIGNCDLAEVKLFLDDLLGTGEFRNCASLDDVLYRLRGPEKPHIDMHIQHLLPGATGCSGKD